MNGSLREIISEIVSALNSIRYGSVEITVHNSKAVQIERKGFVLTRRLIERIFDSSMPTRSLEAGVPN